MARFQNEVIIFFRPEHSRHRRTDGFVRGATVDLRLKVGTPPTEIVVYINRRNFMLLQALLESRDLLGRRDRLAKQLRRFGKRKIVYHINEQKHDRRMLVYTRLWSVTLLVH